MTEKKNTVHGSFNDLNAGGNININVGDRKRDRGLKLFILGVVVIVTIIMLIFQQQPPKPTKSNTNTTHGDQSPIVHDSAGSVNIYYQNTDPFVEDSLKNNKQPK